MSDAVTTAQAHKQGVDAFDAGERSRPNPYVDVPPTVKSRALARAWASGWLLAWRAARLKKE